MGEKGRERGKRNAPVLDGWSRQTQGSTDWEQWISVWNFYFFKICGQERSQRLSSITAGHTEQLPLGCPCFNRGIELIH